MKLDDLTTIAQLTDFLSGTQAVAFSVIDDKDACYRWIQRELVKFRYLTLPRASKGVVMRCLIKAFSVGVQHFPCCLPRPVERVVGVLFSVSPVTWISSLMCNGNNNNGIGISPVHN